MGRTSGARVTAAHAAPQVDSAADISAGPVEPLHASKTPVGENAEEVTEVAGDSFAGANREVCVAEKRKEVSSGTVGKALAADSADKASPPRVQELTREVAGWPGGSDDVGKGPRKSGNRYFKELSVFPHLTLVHKAMRLEADSLERGMLTMNRIEARLDESDKRGRADVADAVQEIRVERANATSQRETAERTLARVEGTVVDLKTLVTSAINGVAERTRTEVWRKLVGLEDSVARAAERGASAGAMILRAMMGNIGGNDGPTTDPVHSADRDPKVGAGAAGDVSLPLMLAGGGEPVRHDKRSVPHVAEGEASNRAKKAKSAGGITSAGPKEAAPEVAATKDAVVASGRPATAAAGTKEDAEESVGDEEAEAREARSNYLAARAAAKGAVRGAEGRDSKSAEIKQTPMVGVHFTPGQKKPFSVELHHGGERFYLGSFSHAGPARYLSAVAQTVWHDRVQSSELVLTDKEEEEWTSDLDLARKMTAGLYAIIFSGNLPLITRETSPFRGCFRRSIQPWVVTLLSECSRRMLNIFKTSRGFLDSKVKPTVESVMCAAIGLEAADDETAVKGKAQKALYAGALAFVVMAVDLGYCAAEFLFRVNCCCLC
ncbi:unnamed protein product [Closterium sp. Yama58-4]|nr:unnamed protein product [Closterium sp. Yama58-4]